MSAVLLGLLSAVGLGIADFMARFSARALGAPLTYAIVLLVGAVGSTAWLVGGSGELTWSPVGWALAIAHGVGVAVMCMLLYAGLARGPIAIVAPIVAAHPALVLAANVAMGTRPAGIEWAAMAAVVAGGVLIARSADGHPQAARDGKGEMRTTVSIAIGACLAYAFLVVTGQAATQIIGEVQTVCLGRWAGLGFVGLVLVFNGWNGRVPRGWCAYVVGQGILDTLGYLAFLAGALTAAPHVAMVVASTFSVVTVLLAYVVLAEPVSRLQWSAVGLIMLGTAALASAS